ncbi:MAG: hypothetical protein ACFE8U_11145, partial [Candidatus Hermodarchaeota archaeon]
AKLQQEVENLSITLSRMQSESETRYQFERDILETYKMYGYKAIQIDTELAVINSTLTPLEKMAYVSRILFALNKSTEYAKTLFSWRLFSHFNTSSEPYVIATQEKQGYNHSLELNLWESLDEIPIQILTHQEMYMLFENSALIQSYPYHQTFYIQAQYWPTKLLYSSIWELQNNINEIVNDANDHDQNADRFAIGVAIHTIAALLISAVQKRTRKEDEEERTYSKWSVLGLVMAVLLALFGLVFPLIYVL